MRIIQVAVGSTRRPKLNAVWEALTVFGPQIDSDAKFEVVAAEVESGVAHTPLSRAETMAGARQRAEALARMAGERSGSSGWEYFVGLEGGFDVVREGSARLVFLQNWAYVLDRSGRGSYGASGAIAVPEEIAQRVVDDGVELADAMDAFTGARGIRDQQGAWGVFTNNLITRQDSFRTAVITAFAPFFNAPAYRMANTAGQGP
jgi:inosine/xanthosine triphosphatase